MAPHEAPVGPQIDGMPLLEPGSRAELRRWLARNHATSRGVWLAVGKKGGHVTELTYDDAVEELLCFGWIDGQSKTLDADRYRLRAVRRKPGSVWAASNKARVERLIASGLMTPAGMVPIERAKADGSWTIIDDVEAMVEPPDLTAALDDSPKARAGFDALTPSSRKIALYWIVTAKRDATRAERIAKTVAAAEEGKAPR